MLFIMCVTFVYSRIKTQLLHNHVFSAEGAKSMHHISLHLLFPKAGTGNMTFSVSRQAVLNENIKSVFRETQVQKPVIYIVLRILEDL